MDEQLEEFRLLTGQEGKRALQGTLAGFYASCGYVIYEEVKAEMATPPETAHHATTEAVDSARPLPPAMEIIPMVGGLEVTAIGLWVAASMAARYRKHNRQIRQVGRMGRRLVEDIEMWRYLNSMQKWR